MELLKEADASLEALNTKTVAVIGYGNQGQAQALNLRDSGVKVIVGNRDDEYRQQAIADGFKPQAKSTRLVPTHPGLRNGLRM